MVPNPNAHYTRTTINLTLLLVSVYSFNLIDGLLRFGSESDEILEGGFDFMIGMCVISSH